MNCTVCGNGITFLARLTAHLGVCKRCREQADSRMQLLIRAVGTTQSFNLHYAQGWIDQFDETARNYRMPELQAGPLRLLLLNNIFKLIEAEDEMPDADLKFIAALGQKYALGQSATPELRDTIFRVGTKEVIQSWEHGETPRKECSGIVLQKSEVCHWEEGAGLRVQKITREYVGGYSSVSVPVPLIRGARFRVGGFRGHQIDNTSWEDGGAGVLHITNQRICFAGQQRSVAIPYKKMISIGGFESGFIVQTSNEKKPGIFVVRHPELTTHLLTLASNPNPRESARRKAQKKPGELNEIG